MQEIGSSIQKYNGVIMSESFIQTNNLTTLRGCLITQDFQLNMIKLFMHIFIHFPDDAFFGPENENCKQAERCHS